MGRMIRRSGLLGLGLLLVGGVSHAAPTQKPITTGKLVLQRCEAAISYFDHKQKRDMYDVGWCLGFVKGIGNGYLIGINKSSVRRLFCPPPKLTVGEEVRAVVRFLNQNSAHLEKGGSVLTLVALMKAFPCPGIKNINVKTK